MEGTAGAAAAIIERAPWQPGSHRESRGGPSAPREGRMPPARARALPRRAGKRRVRARSDLESRVSQISFDS